MLRLLPGAGRDQKAFILDNQQRREMLRFQHCDGQMTDCRENGFHTGKDALCIDQPTTLLVLCHATATASKHFFR